MTLARRAPHVDARRIRRAGSIIAALVLSLYSTTAGAQLLAGGASSVPQPVPVPFMGRGEVIMFGTTAGATVGACTLDPSGGGLGQFAAIYSTGKVVTRGWPSIYPGPHLGPMNVRHLVRLAVNLGFFHMPGFTYDTTCAGMATTYIHIRYGKRDHTVEIYGFNGFRHPQLAWFLQQLSKAVS